MRDDRPFRRLARKNVDQKECWSINKTILWFPPTVGTAIALPVIIGVNFLKRVTLPILEIQMLNWALTFFVLAMIAAILGFGGIAASAASIGKILFVLFLVLFAVSLIANAARGRSGV